MFFSFESSCSALLEDSKGRGRQFITSKAGSSYWLKSKLQASSFFQGWKESITFEPCDFPAIQQLIYAAYEVGTVLETLPEPKTAVPEGLLWRHEPEWSMCFDSQDSKVYLASNVSEKQLDDLEAMLAHGQGNVDLQLPNKLAKVMETTVANYMQAVECVKQYIREGDVFQANIARSWQMNFPSTYVLALYQRLRRVNAAPFSCFVRAGELTLLSASPERLFALSSDGIAETRPIAGTRRRSEGDEDEALQDELLLSDKERAEHIMLVDLERNDLGRVCVPGSIEVNERMVIEKYATVQHIVSNVRGVLSDQHDVIDLFCAMFPGGTITGCPKVRCMEIIDELEQKSRGPYTGSVGYIAWDGSADMNILIRTFWHHQDSLYWAAGAGIVADSDAVHERIETEHKAEGLLRALSEKNKYK